MRANLTNVGGEGQICVGGMLATAVALHGAGTLPRAAAVLVPLVAGTLAGALWGGLAGFLKAKRGSNEVITTLLLTFIALQMVYGSVQSESLLRQPRTDSSTLPESLEIPELTQLPLLVGSDRGLPLHAGLILEILAVIAVGVVLAQSPVGLKLRAVGRNEMASMRAGISVDRVVIAALAVSGAFGGLAGAIMIQGDQHYLTSGFSSGFGFDGLVVGLLARGSVLAAVACALLFGCLRSGGMSMEMTAQVPSSVVVVCQGLIVIAIAATAAARARSS
jgi:simple sugar transport system permease protein